jgi:hypothetical protein
VTAEIVPQHLLEAFAWPDGRPSQAARGGADSRTGNGQAAIESFDVEEWLGEYGEGVNDPRSAAGGSRVWGLDVCPFNVEHNRREAYVLQRASGAVVAGCLHESCTWRWHDLRQRWQRGWVPFDAARHERLRREETEWLDAHFGGHRPREVSTERPIVIVSDRDLDDLVDETSRVLVETNLDKRDIPRMFNRGAGVYAEVIWRHGTPELRSMTVDALIRRMSEAAHWAKIVGGGNPRTVSARPPADVAKQLTVALEEPFPGVSRIVRTPVFARDGHLILGDGLHGDVLCLLDQELKNLAIELPIQPEELESAVALFRYQMADMPYEDEASFAHTMALALLPFARQLVNGPTPLHVVRAHIHGSSKTLLAHVALMPFCGGEPESQAEVADLDDWSKVLTSTLATGPAVVFIDNVSQHLASGNLASALTKTTWSGRELGFSRNITVPISCVWLATGNNLTLSGELTRRAVPINLAPQLEQPWMRDPAEFREPDLRGWTKQHRRDLVKAAVTIIQAWIEAGRPRYEHPTLGSYESWSRVMGGVLGNAGVGGFLDNLDQFRGEVDVDSHLWQQFVTEWWAWHKDDPLTAGQLLDVVDEPSNELLIALPEGTRRSREMALAGLVRKNLLGRVFDTFDAEGGRVRVDTQSKRGKPRYVLAPIR